MTEACFCDPFSNFLCSYIPVTYRQFYEYFFSYQIYQVLISEPFDFFFFKIVSGCSISSHTAEDCDVTSVFTCTCVHVHTTMQTYILAHILT